MLHKKRIVLPAAIATAVLVSLVLTGRSAAQAGSWTIETIDASGGAGFYSSLELDSTGAPRVAYYDNSLGVLKFATRSASAVWTIQTLESSYGYSSLALDGAGNPHIAHQGQNTGSGNPNSQKLRYVHFDGVQWLSEMVDGGGRSTSITLDAGGAPNISYGSGGLKYAKRVGSTWVTQLVEPAKNGADEVYGTSIALDAFGSPRISYHNSKQKSLRYASWTGSSWSVQTVDAVSGRDVGFRSSLALDGSGNPRIAYLDTLLNGTDPHVRYAEWNGSGWTTVVVDASGHPASGGTSSLKFDVSGNPHIGYRGPTSSTIPSSLRYARRIGGIWTIEVVDPASAGYYTSLELDGLGNPRISYRGDGTILKFARKDG